MLYKYRKLYSKKDKKNEFNRHTMAILKENKIYIPSYEELNDPWEKIIEIPPYKSYTKSEEMELLKIDNEASKLGFYGCNSFGKGILKDQNELDSIRSDFNNIMYEESDWGIFSMSMLNDSLLLWAHYGDEHRGICIGFNKEAFLNTDNVIKVKYRKKIPSINPKRVYRRPEKQYFGNKHFAWSYEKEYRYLHPELSVEITSPANINSIFLGIRVDDEIVERIRCEFSKKYTTYKAIMDKSSYRINYTEIT